MEVPIKISKVTSNDSHEMIYIPKEIVRHLGFKKGTKIIFKLDTKNGRLIIEKLPDLPSLVKEVKVHG